MIWFVYCFIFVFIAWFLITYCYLRGENLRKFDHPVGQRFSSGDVASDEHDAVLAAVSRLFEDNKKTPLNQRFRSLRQQVDSMTSKVEFISSFTDVEVNGIPAEWVVAPGTDGSRRLLYIHGGGYVMGSPRSHRVITSKFSEIFNAAVLVIDYRLMPEHSRMDGINDCRTAYPWMLENGPGGESLASKVYVAGDSAGGNLTLSLLAWIHDNSLRVPDAAVALSPATDSTMSSPSLKSNLETDHMLRPVFGFLSKSPRIFLLWSTWMQNRIRPNDPVISPVFGDLSALPPLLIQASEAEMLLDDSRRYVNRAIAAGSPIRLQTWAHMVHVWQIFYPQLTEARQAYDEIEKFIAEVG